MNAHIGIRFLAAFALIFFVTGCDSDDGGSGSEETGEEETGEEETGEEETGEEETGEETGEEETGEETGPDPETGDPTEEGGEEETGEESAEETGEEAGEAEGGEAAEETGAETGEEAGEGSEETGEEETGEEETGEEETGAEETGDPTETGEEETGEEETGEEGVVDCTDPADAPPTYDDDIFPLVSVACAGCHTASSSGGVNFATYGGITATGKFGEPVYVRMIARAVDTKQMPKGTNPDLNSDEEELILAWVDAGVPENGDGIDPPLCD